MSADLETPHPGPFVARARDGVHEVVDGHGVVVATCTGEWAHIVAPALALAITRAAEMEEELSELRAVMEGVDCHDAVEPAREEPAHAVGDVWEHEPSGARVEVAEVTASHGETVVRWDDMSSGETITPAELRASGWRRVRCAEG